MKNLTQLVNNIPQKAKAIRTGIGLGLAGAVLYGTVSCDEALFPSMTDAQKTTLAGSALVASSEYMKDPKDARNAAVWGSLIGIYGQMKQEIDVARAGQTQVIVNNPPVNQNNYVTNQNETKDNSTPKGLFMYKKWVDFNGNGIGEEGEYVGFNERVYDFKNLDFLSFSVVGHKEAFSLRVWGMEDGNLVYEDSYLACNSCSSYKPRDFYIGPDHFPKSGKYKVVLNTATNETFSLDFEVVK